MDSLTEAFDELNIQNEKGITKNFEKDEKIFLSCLVFKFNDYKKRQERKLLVTNKAVYNLKGTSSKRRIDVKKIKAITIGQVCTEFVLHVPEEYDYRYSSTDKKNKILLAIVKAIVQVTGQKVPIFQKDDITLFNYATTKTDKKKGLSRQPSEDPKFVDEQQLNVILQGQTKDNDETKRRTSTLWTREKGRNVTLDDFNTLKVLGAGAFGTVMLVEDKKTGEWFAMKVIKKDIILKKGQYEHTKTEKMILEHVNHPYLVTLVYAFQDPQRLFFVMQFMKGGELFQHLRMSRKFEERRAKFYAAQLALGLGHLHSKDIVYRDLKLENILMDELGNVYVSDFGMSKVIKSDELAMTFCGTPEYLSPEVILGQGCDKTTDWWSLGILTYEMMYGLPPYYNKNQSQMFKLIKEGELKFPKAPETSDEAKDFITKCLNRDRTQRLGAKKDIQEIMSHPWFKDMNWDKLLKKELPPPFKPKVNDDQWLENFDKDFTTMKPALDENDGKKFEPDKDPFKEWN